MGKKKVEKILKRHLKGWALVFVFASLILGLVTGYFLKKMDYEKRDHETIIKLNGSDIVYLDLGEAYEESGYEVIIDGINYTDKVVTHSNLDINKEGTYYIEYALLYEDQMFKTIRIIIVSGGKVNG